MGEGQDRVAERARRPVNARRIVAAVLVAVIAVAGFAVGAGAQPPAEPRIVQPPADNVFPIPVPDEVTFSDGWHACRDGCYRPHKGNDLMADEGVPLVAVEPGVIVRANATDDGLGGVTLWLLGDSGVAYYYAHNSQNLAAEGQRVARGQVIATVGRTGNAATPPPHLHFQINLCGDTSSNEPCTVDPVPLCSWSQAQVGGGTDGVGLVRARARARSAAAPSRARRCRRSRSARPGARPGAAGRRLGRRRPRLGRSLPARPTPRTPCSTTRVWPWRRSPSAGRAAPTSGRSPATSTATAATRSASTGSPRRRS